MKKWATVSFVLLIGIAGTAWMTPAQAEGRGGPPEPREIATFEYRCLSDASGYFLTQVYLRGSSFGVGNQQLTYRNGNGGTVGTAACRDLHVPAVEAIGQASSCISSRLVYTDNSSRADLLLTMVCAGSRDQVIQALFDTVAYAVNAGF
jgi:hypothetical protein